MEIISKASIRKKYKELRSNLSSGEIDALSEEITKQLLKNFQFNNSIVHLFLTIEKLKEVNTLYLMNELFKLNVSLSTSVYNNSITKHVHIFHDTQYKKGHLDIPIPNSSKTSSLIELDFIIVPLLGYDNKGNRIGYGKGIYDNILSKCSENCKKIGVSFFDPEPEFSSEPHDIKLDFCQTPNTLFNFNK